MLSFLLAPRPTVLALLTDDDEASVGPESAAGWTVAWVDDPDLVDEVGTAIMVDEAGMEEVALSLRRDGSTRSWWWTVAEDEAPADDSGGVVEAGDIDTGVVEVGVGHTGVVGPYDIAPPANEDGADGAARELAAALGAAGEVRSALRELLAQRREPNSFVEQLAAITGLPAPARPTPVRALVLSRSTPAAMRLTGEIASTGLGDIALADLGDGWSGLLPLENPELGPHLAEAVGRMIAAQGLRSRKKRALLLWRGENGAAGFELHRGEDLYAARGWGTGWTDTVSADLSVRDTFVEELLVFFSDAVEQGPRLRSLMRAEARDHDPLTELVDLLDLPSDAISLLEPRSHGTAEEHRDESPVPLELLEPAGLGRFLRGLVTGRGLPPLAPRWVLFTYGMLCAAVTLLFALLAVTEAAVIWTDGAFVDQPAATSEDWIFLLFSVIVTIIGATITTGSFLGARTAE